jgi:hypothetical protein
MAEQKEKELVRTQLIIDSLKKAVNSNKMITKR